MNKILLLLGICLILTGCNDHKFKQHFLLVVHPVTEEYLGTIESKDWLHRKLVFVDCLGKEHDITSGEIKSTIDTCE